MRKATICTLLQLGKGNPELAAASLDYLIDMLNDELEAVRVHVAAGLAGMQGEPRSPSLASASAHVA